jgi:DNA-binding MarR family transcriptional regulator
MSRPRRLRTIPVAAESPRWLSDLEQEAWRDWLEVMRRLPTVLEARLQARSGLTITDYQVLVELSEAPDRRLRMTQLAHRTCLSKSRLSHQVKRMESVGLIERAECPEDRRGSFAVLTRRGLHALTDAAPDHVEDVRELFVDLLPSQDLPGFARSLAVVAAELETRARKEREEHEQAARAARREDREIRADLDGTDLDGTDLDDTDLDGTDLDDTEHRAVAGNRGSREGRDGRDGRESHDSRESRHGGRPPSREPVRR